MKSSGNSFWRILPYEFQLNIPLKLNCASTETMHGHVSTLVLVIVNLHVNK